MNNKSIIIKKMTIIGTIINIKNPILSLLRSSFITFYSA
nr:MAG TPA: hypothetical protein [Crassvirales sp.]